MNNYILKSQNPFIIDKPKCQVICKQLNLGLLRLNSIDL